MGYLLAGIHFEGIGNWRGIALFLASLLLSALCYTNWVDATYIYNSGMALTLVNIPNVGWRLLGGFSGAFVFLLLMEKF